MLLAGPQSKRCFSSFWARNKACLELPPAPPRPVGRAASLCGFASGRLFHRCLGMESETGPGAVRPTMRAHCLPGRPPHPPAQLYKEGEHHNRRCFGSVSRLGCQGQEMSHAGIMPPLPPAPFHWLGHAFTPCGERRRAKETWPPSARMALGEKRHRQVRMSARGEDSVACTRSLPRKQSKLNPLHKLASLKRPSWPLVYFWGGGVAQDDREDQVGFIRSQPPWNSRLLVLLSETIAGQPARPGQGNALLGGCLPPYSIALGATTGKALRKRCKGPETLQGGQSRRRNGRNEGMWETLKKVSLAFSCFKMGVNGGSLPAANERRGLFNPCLRGHPSSLVFPLLSEVKCCVKS